MKIFIKTAKISNATEKYADEIKNAAIYIGGVL